MMFDLTGMTALVTGASGGLGSSIAKALSAQGARLAVSGSNVGKLEAFRSGLGGDHVALPCNLSDGAAVDQLVPQAVDALGGKLDILINNAGVTKDNLLMRMKDEEFEDVIRINLEAGNSSRPGKKQKRARFASQDLHEKGPHGLRLEDIEIPDPGPRTISKAEKILAQIMAPNDGPSLIFPFDHTTPPPYNNKSPRTTFFNHKTTPSLQIRQHGSLHPNLHHHLRG